MEHNDTPNWVKDAVFYQIFPDRFAKSSTTKELGNLQPWGDSPTYHAYQGGNLDGIRDKLDYLDELGVNAIYLNPIFASAANHRYHTYDYCRIDPILGDMDAFERLCEAVHRRGMRLVLDGVFNHASRGFYQFNHLLENGAESPYSDWFTVHRWPLNAFSVDEPPNYAAWWGLHALPKFNIHTPAVREFLWNVAVYWLQMGIDGWRLDVPEEIDDVEFWREFRKRCRAVNPEAYLVGELWGEARRWLQGDQFDGQMNYMIGRAAIGFFLGERADQTDTPRTGYGYIHPLGAKAFASELERICNQLYQPDVVLAQLNMLGSHDTPRIMTIARDDADAVRLMFLFQMTMPGAPNIYYGDEIGLHGGRDPDCRRAFPWHDQASWNRELLHDVQQFLALRRETRALRRGSFRVLSFDDEDVIVYARQHEEQLAIVAFNKGTRQKSARIDWGSDAQALLEEKLTKSPHNLHSGQKVVLKARSGRVWIGEDRRQKSASSD